MSGPVSSTRHPITPSPIDPSRPRRRNRQKPSCRNIFSQLVMEMRILIFPVLILFSLSAKEYCDYISNIKCFKITLALCACHNFSPVTIIEFFVSFIRIYLMTYFNKIKKNIEYETHSSCHFCQHTLYSNVLPNSLSNMKPYSTLSGQSKWAWVKHNGNSCFLAHTDLVLWQKRDQSHFGLK
jgi:hypothetical protein